MRQVTGPKSSEPLLLVLLGPTASGKSSLAVSTAAQLRGEIVNCDSMQMVRHMNIGTAKPTDAEREKVTHHLYDLIEPNQYFSAGEYMTLARQTCHEISRRGKTPVVVGGTGLYVRALLEGVFDGPGRSEGIRNRLTRIAAKRGTSWLHRWLERRDSGVAHKIMPHDQVRIIRALEISLLTGRSISEMLSQRAPLEGYEVLKVGISLSRELLYDRINRRVERMFEGGLLEEVRSLLEAGFSSRDKGFEALGYRYAVQALSGRMTRKQAVELTQRDTRRYAKRQLTWFRKEPKVNWIPGPGEAPGAITALLDLIHRGIEENGV